ncbi:Mismatch repair endonuclease PMS2 [Oopsacas minuta]|uniref:Mismatch repair endonuclease PMS2 n=1 Tax=Oopsacas minuta TaxID=111878 RepID=A0AAV7KKY4_9METZ|nr:Mismatch repair endonuclease PMS2 [Oopsacas minuta]
MSIKPLSRDAVQQICSSQVIISLSATLKELIENSLDAKATAIEVYLDNYGSESIEVVDNGEGILPQNFSTICLKHFTSKLTEFSDLQELETFGFRGEALSSMCAVSDMSIVTHHASQDVGSCLEYNSSGELVNSSPCAAQIGTRVSIKKIFLHMPVRRIELMKNIKREFNKLLQILYGYCIIRPDVRFQCFLTTKKEKSLVINTTETNSMKDVLISIFGTKSSKSLIPVTKCEYNDVTSNSTHISYELFDQIELTGYISSPEPGSGRSNSDRQFFFLNSRPCDYSALSRLLNELYHEYDRNHYPFVILSIYTKANQLDVNLTPDKRSILLHSEQLVFDIIRSSIAKLFLHYITTFSTCLNLTAQCKLSHKSPTNLNKQNRNYNRTSPRRNAFSTHLKSFRDISPNKHSKPIHHTIDLPSCTAPVKYSMYIMDTATQRVSRESIVTVDIVDIRNAINSNVNYNRKSFDNIFSARINPEHNDKAEAELRKELSKDSFNLMEVVGQFNLGFIITRLGSHLFIIDQHATDEKYRFEVLQTTEHITSQPLITPLPLEMSVVTELVIMDNMNTYEMNGFDIAVDEHSSPTHRLKLRTLPMSKGWIFGEDEIEEMALLLQDRPGVLCRPSKIRSMFASRACRSAVMIGTALSLKEMERIVRNMAQMEQPWQCPHGRPTMRHLTTVFK